MKNDLKSALSAVTSQAKWSRFVAIGVLALFGLGILRLQSWASVGYLVAVGVAFLVIVALAAWWFDGVRHHRDTATRRRDKPAIARKKSR